MKYLPNILLILISVFVAYQELRLYQMKGDLQVVYNRQSLRDRKYKLDETDFVRTAKNSVLIVRCVDKTSPAKAWIATATKVHPEHIVTVFHNISRLGNNLPRTYPIACQLTQEGQKMGDFKIESEKDAIKTQVEKRDISIVPVVFNEKGAELPILMPKNLSRIAVGDVIALISSPAKFHLDATVSFGVVLAKKVKHSLKVEFREIWENAISSDVIAFGGSSGGALIHFDPDPYFVGVHVGTNGANGLYLAYYQLLFDKAFFQKFNALP